MNPPNQKPHALIALALAFFVVIAIWALPTSHAQGQVQVTAANPASGAQGTVNFMLSSLHQRERIYARSEIGLQFFYIGKILKAPRLLFVSY